MRDKHRFSSRIFTEKTYSGQTLVEFALVLLALLPLLLGFLDLGRAWFYHSSLTNAVREGARAGIVIPYDEEAIQDIVRKYAFGLNSDATSLIIEPSVVSRAGFPDSLKIEASYCFVPVTPMITSIVGSNCTDETPGITLTATTVMMLFEP